MSLKGGIGGTILRERVATSISPISDPPIAPHWVVRQTAVERGVPAAWAPAVIRLAVDHRATTGLG